MGGVIASEVILMKSSLRRQKVSVQASLSSNEELLSGFPRVIGSIEHCTCSNISDTQTVLLEGSS